MPINKKVYVQEQFADTDEWNLVSDIADDLFGYLSDPGVVTEIDELNVPGTSSKKNQDVLLKKALAIGFRDESEGLFNNYPNSVHPYDFSLWTTSGIYQPVEVVQGSDKTRFDLFFGRTLPGNYNWTLILEGIVKDLAGNASERNSAIVYK